MLTHVDPNNQPSMVDVQEKSATLRTAKAEGFVRLTPEILAQFDGRELISKKGPVFATAIVAGTQAVKKTADLIPFCHPLSIESCKFQMTVRDQGIHIECMVQLTGKTGVEMEALTGVSVAALTIYDMCKALSHDIEIGSIALVSKQGGKRDVRKESALDR